MQVRRVENQLVAGPVRQRGITLIELLVALAIVAVLSAVAFPTYRAYSQRSYRTQAFTDLAQCALNSERQHTNTFTYTGIATGTTPVATICSQFSPSDAAAAANASYRITVTSATANGFTFRATPINGQDGDGMLELDATGAKRWDQNNDGDFADAGETNWQD